jgi:hypothetical protein
MRTHLFSRDVAEKEEILSVLCCGCFFQQQEKRCRCRKGQKVYIANTKGLLFRFLIAL